MAQARGQTAVMARRSAAGPVIRSGRGRWRVWLAVLALLLQAILPDAAMAARGGPVGARVVGVGSIDGGLGTSLLVAPDPAAWAVGCGPSALNSTRDAANDAANDAEDAAGNAGAPADGAPHAPPCAFCLALSAHALPLPDGGALAVLRLGERLESVWPRVRVALSARRSNHAPRAPPVVWA